MCPHSATDRFEIENVGVKQRPDGRCIAEFGADEEDEEEDEELPPCLDASFGINSPNFKRSCRRLGTSGFSGSPCSFFIFTRTRERSECASRGKHLDSSMALKHIDNEMISII